MAPQLSSRYTVGWIPSDGRGRLVSVGERSRTTVDERLDQIEALTEGALAFLDLDDLLSRLLDRVRELLSADTAAVLMIDRSTQQLVPIAAKGIEAEVRANVRIPIGKGFAGTIAVEQRAKTLYRVDSTTVANPILWETGITSMLGVPLLVEGRITGVLHVGTLTARRFDREDTKLLQLAADRIALATEARTSQADRAAARSLQRSLLPPELPTVEGVDLAGRHVAGAGDVGGDWYDVFTLPSGRLSIVIGDVSGRGLGAAVAMGRLRSALRAYALESEDPADVLARLDRQAQHFQPGLMATVLYGIVEPCHSRVRVSCAGHLPPVVAEPGQPAKVVDLTGNLPLGVQLDYRRHTADIDLHPGTVLCCYTDGLVERRGRPLEVGVDQLRHAVTPIGSAEAVCSNIMTGLVGTEVIADDIAVLVLRRHN